MKPPAPSSERAALQSSLHESVDEYLKRLSRVWHAIGLSENQQYDRTTVVQEHMQSLLEDMSAEEEECQAKLEQSVKSLQTDYTKLCLQLSVCETQLGDNLTLLARDEELRKLASGLKKEKVQRVQKMKSLLQEEGELCSRLSRDAQLAGINQEQVPTLKQLQSWSEIVICLREEKESYTERLCTLQRSVQSLWLQMDADMSDAKPDSLAYKLNMDDGVSQLPLTDETEQACLALVTEVEAEVTALVTAANTLRSQISCLYGRLDVSPEDQDAFLGQYCDCRKPTVAALQNELDRLEELKRQHMSVFIERIRTELADLWDQLQFGPMQREQFAPAFSEEEAGDELLSAHESEVERVKQYIAETADIYTLVTKRETLWTRMQELLANANNPNRYNNRGGQLLKEEKARKALSKELPKVEKELRQNVEAYEEQAQASFMINDERYLDAIASQWEGLQSKKDQDKTKRKAKEDVPPAVTPLKRRPTTAPSAGHGPAKRRVPVTPSGHHGTTAQTTFVQTKSAMKRGASSQQSSARRPATSATSRSTRTPLQSLQAKSDPEASYALAGNLEDPDCTVGSIAALNYKDFEATVTNSARCSSMGRANEMIPSINFKS